MVDLTDDELLAELGITVEQPTARTRSPRDERIVAGFDDIREFHKAHGRAPQHGEQRDILERLYALRLDKLRQSEECRSLLASIDTERLLSVPSSIVLAAPEELDDDALLAELGVQEAGVDDITQLRHVQSREERRAAEEIANREPCRDFEKFEPLFDEVASDLDAKRRESRPFGKDASIAKGEFFVLGGQIAYVAEVGDTIRAPNGEFDARLRVVFSNGTESNLLRRSLQRALYKDETGRRITDLSAGPLFGDEASEDDQQSGTIYVLRSNSSHPMVEEHRELIHKIGFTGGSVEARVATADKDPTYLLAKVEIVAEYKLYGVARRQLEALLHKVFSTAVLDLTINDRFGNPVKPREWFLVPLTAIDDAIAKIRSGAITDYIYDPKLAQLVRR